MEAQLSPYIRYVFPTKLTRFFEELKNNKLMATRCAKCGALRCPPSIDCPKCLSSEVEWVELSGKGKLLTHTVVHIAPASLVKKAPYIVGIIELNEGPRMMAQLVNVKPENLRIGLPVQVVFDEGFGGQRVYKFKPEV